MDAPSGSTRPTRCVVVVAGGDRLTRASVADLESGGKGERPLVVAADSGVDHALALGLHVDLAVGDFDSVSAAGLAEIEAAGTTVERHPAAKDETDLELALDRAVQLGATRIVVLGGHGGRLDHWLANVFLLTSDRYASTTVEARFGPARLHVVRDRLQVTGEVGDLVTLLAVAGPVHGVTTDGLSYPLADATLEPASSRGVSNELTARSATIRLRSGTLVVVVPGERGAHVLGAPPRSA